MQQNDENKSRVSDGKVDQSEGDRSKQVCDSSETDKQEGGMQNQEQRGVKQLMRSKTKKKGAW